MPPIGTIEGLLRDWLAWHLPRQHSTHALKLEGEQLAQSLRMESVRDSDSRVVRALELIDELERLASSESTSLARRRLELRTLELKNRIAEERPVRPPAGRNLRRIGDLVASLRAR